MTFLEKYTQERRWHGKVRIMEIFHLTMSHNHENWTISKTARCFNVSIGLVSENLKLAQALHINEKLGECLSRQDALKKVKSNGQSNYVERNKRARYME